MAEVYILKGERPKKPIFSTTRGYTEELWEMTTSCWKRDPSDRPTVAEVLCALKNAAEQCESECGEMDTPSPKDDRNTALAEESDLSMTSKHENKPPHTASTSLDPFQPFVTKSLTPIALYHPEPPATADPRTPHPQSDTAKTAPSASPTTAGVQSQYTSDTPLTPDEMLDRILVSARSPLGEDGAQNLVDDLEKVSRRYPLPMG